MDGPARDLGPGVSVTFIRLPLMRQNATDFLLLCFFVIRNRKEDFTRTGYKLGLRRNSYVVCVSCTSAHTQINQIGIGGLRLQFIVHQ